MSEKTSEAGSAHVIIIAVIVIALLGALGFAFWKNSTNTNHASGSEPERKEDSVVAFCKDGENSSATNGVFCSEEMGIKLTVPGIFKDKIAAMKNYEVFKGSLDPSTKASAGTSERVFGATSTEAGTPALVIAQEPLRTGYVNVAHMLQQTYYDQESNKLTLVTAPSRHYDSATDTFTQSGSYTLGAEVPSFTIGDTRLFKATNGDAGVQEVTYFGVVNKNIIKISLRSESNPAMPEDANIETLFSSLDSAVKEMQIATK